MTTHGYSPDGTHYYITYANGTFELRIAEPDYYDHDTVLYRGKYDDCYAKMCELTNDALFL